MYNKLIIEYLDGEQVELIGSFFASDIGDGLTLSKVEGNGIMKWARQEIKKQNKINTIEIQKANSSGKLFNRFSLVHFVDFDTIQIK